MAVFTRFTSGDLDLLPENGNRYEIIDGELYETKQPSWNHQGACDNFVILLGTWSHETGLGFVRQAPGDFRPRR